jgi:S-adenosylmethionine synthetase
MQRTPRTAEHVSEGHPDKFCDQVADLILDEALRLAGGDDRVRKSVRIAIECLAKDNLLVVSGETKLTKDIRREIDVAELGREVWRRVGYGDDGNELTVVDHIRSQSPNIARGVDTGGAGDQGIMVGYATNETPELMPQEWVSARDICLRLAELRRTKAVRLLKSDCKSQVTLNADGMVTRVIIAAQHEKPTETYSLEDMERSILSLVIEPLIIGEKHAEWAQITEGNRHSYAATGPQGPVRAVINGTGEFEIGGPTGDAGVVGRKIVVDAYGPRVAVGGGCYSGKDPTKVDRTGAYMARHIAKTIVTENMKAAKECTVTMAYAIGQLQPEMVTAVIDSGIDIWPSIRKDKRWKDLSPDHIIEAFGLRQPSGWSYVATAAYGHYGRPMFPWEKVATQSATV